MWGETRNANPKGYLDRFTCAGYIVLTSLLFAFGVGAYQALFIHTEQQNAVREAAEKAGETARIEAGNAQARAEKRTRNAQARADIEAQRAGELTRTLGKLREEAHAHAAGTLEKIKLLQGDAAECPKVQGRLEGLATFVRGLPDGTTTALQAQLAPILDFCRQGLGQVAAQLITISGDVATLKQPPTDSTDATHSAGGAASGGAGGAGAASGGSDGAQSGGSGGAASGGSDGAQSGGSGGTN